MLRSTLAAARAVALPLVALLAGGCAIARRPATLAPAPEACTLLPPPTTPPESIRIALTNPVDPMHAPEPRNASERFLFAQLYEGLVHLDCTGHARPALARAWSVDPSGRRWTFTLRDSARFHDGTPVTASDVIASWRSTGARSGADDSFAAVLAATSIAPDTHTLVVTLPDSATSLDLFAAPELAVMRAASAGGWPVGTRLYGVDTARGPLSDGIALAPVDAADGVGPRLIVTFDAGRDARDALDAGADLLVTDNPSVIQYALTEPSFVTASLPWARSYGLLVPTRVAERDAPPDSIARSFRNALAAAVHADARGAMGPFWWSDAGAASAADSSSGFSSSGFSSRPAPAAPYVASANRILYARGDLVARDLATRLVALAESGDAVADSAALLARAVPELANRIGGWRAVGLDSTSFVRALHSGDESAYVIALPRRVLDTRAAARSFLASAPWLGAILHLDEALIPLIEVRRTAIARRGAVGLVTQWDGTPIITPSWPPDPERAR